jgi:hypothetical protein
MYGRAVYFVLSFGLLTLFYVRAVLSFDVVGATYLWCGLAALIAAGLTPVGSVQRGHVLLAIGMAVLVVVVIFALTFSFQSGAAALVGLLALQP